MPYPRKFRDFAARQAGKPLVSNVDLVAGAAANTNIAIAGIKRTDIIRKVIEVPASAAMVDRTSVASVTSDGNIQLTASTAGNQLLVFWLQGS